MVFNMSASQKKTETHYVYANYYLIINFYQLKKKHINGFAKL